ncbi:hypothetical protein DSO57_1039246 [Entomophthora muscae]|uniref:Uncharacterized protein n=1 Tax=Entomophthora muscae TaxID=34485 RepID=A0ACC2RD72_9FUNG|nr:hypothetical protein DSO57_1039246 [Entomophthora muscae]
MQTSKIIIAFCALLSKVLLPKQQRLEDGKAPVYGSEPASKSSTPADGKASAEAPKPEDGKAPVYGSEPASDSSTPADGKASAEAPKPAEGEAKNLLKEKHLLEQRKVNTTLKHLHQLEMLLQKQRSPLKQRSVIAITKKLLLKPHPPQMPQNLLELKMMLKKTADIKNGTSGNEKGAEGDNTAESAGGVDGADGEDNYDSEDSEAEDSAEEPADAKSNEEDSTPAYGKKQNTAASEPKAAKGASYDASKDQPAY